MTLVKKIGYITLIYWGCQISLKIISKLYTNFYLNNESINLSNFGEWAMVTGCSSGIGKAFAEQLARKRLNIILVNVIGTDMCLLQQDLIENLSKNLENSYRVKTKILALDVSRGLDSYKLIENEIIGLKIGVLVNSFGQNYPHPEYFLDLPHNDKIFMNIITCNVGVITNLCRIILPQMVLRQKGVIINVGSLSSVIPTPLLTVFAATKAYTLNFSHNLQIEYDKHGIIIQCLLPGSINNFTKNHLPHTNSWISPSAEEYVESAIKRIGKDEITAGFFPHIIFLWLMQVVDKFTPAFLAFAMLNIMEINRNRAIQKYLC